MYKMIKYSHNYIHALIYKHIYVYICKYQYLFTYGDTEDVKNRNNFKFILKITFNLSSIKKKNTISF